MVESCDTTVLFKNSMKNHNLLLEVMILKTRPDGYEDFYDFTLQDALSNIFQDMNVPVLYNVDVGHIPPQLTFINGSFAEVEFKNKKAKIIQKLI